MKYFAILFCALIALDLFSLINGQNYDGRGNRRPRGPRGPDGPRGPGGPDRNGNIGQGGSTGSKVFCKTREGINGECSPIASCFNHYAGLQAVKQNGCQYRLNNQNVAGVCCPLEMVQHRNQGRVPFNFDPPDWPTMRIPIRPRDIVRAVERTEDEILTYLSMEVDFMNAGYAQRRNSLAAMHQSVFGPPNENLQAMNLAGFRALQVTRRLARRFRLTPREARDGLSQMNLRGTMYERFCPAPPRCDPRSRYRTIDGSCNNLEHTLWGKSLTQYYRFLPPAYSDGLSEFRFGAAGSPLPLARSLSTHLMETKTDAHPLLSVMFMQFGQFIDHDITLGSSTRAANGQGLTCCNRTHLESPVFHPACRPIIIPKRDPFYSRLRENPRCNNFVRNAVGMKNECQLGFREQTNVITAFIDASMVYGNQPNRSGTVRLFRDGLLKVAQINRREFLPYDTGNTSLACSIPATARMPGDAQRQCLLAGDVRVNQQVGLVVLQLVFLREHNRIVRELKKLNRNWNDETLFQEGRRIVGAMMQHITYNEWLPLSLGPEVIRATGLRLQPVGYASSYDTELNPSILSEFAGAAFRWHTLVQNSYSFMNANGRRTEQHRLWRVFNNPSLLYRDGAIDEVTYGLLTERSEKFDPIFVDDIKNLMFATANASFGLDLVAINIQRGRDHGIPPYNEVRLACGLPPAKSFDQLDAMMRPGAGKKFDEIYDHVDDIDLFVGGVNEPPLPGAIVGATFACIVAEQFRRLKYGDRFWYENGRMPHSFTEAQLSEIRKVSLAGLLCVNGDSIRTMQPFAMIAKSRDNPLIDCKHIPHINLQHWKA